jgi:hypothetical protein
MKLLAMCTAVLALFSSQAIAGCNDGEQLEVTGTVSRMFANKAGGWSIILNRLNDEVQSCDLMGLGGQKTASGTWYLLAVRERPSSSCRAGSHVRATLKVSESLVGYSADTVRWQCN